MQFVELETVELNFLMGRNEIEQFVELKLICVWFLPNYKQAQLRLTSLALNSNDLS